MAGVVRNSRIISIKFQLLILLMTVIFGQSMAQEADSRKGFKHVLGVKVGQNYSWINLEPSVDQNALTGPVIGISYLYMPQYFGGILIEAQYIQYGWEEIFLDNTSSYSRELSYLELPILTNLVLGRKKTHLKVQVGIKFDILLNDKENSNLPEEQLQYYNGLEIDDPVELGLAFGASISRIFPFGEIQLDTRYNAGLSNLFDPTEDISLLYSQNQALTFSAYYWFKVK
jgi:hypothetical protein